jgi:hypothetical protein
VTVPGGPSRSLQLCLPTPAALHLERQQKRLHPFSETKDQILRKIRKFYPETAIKRQPKPKLKRQQSASESAKVEIETKNGNRHRVKGKAKTNALKKRKQ